MAGRAPDRREGPMRRQFLSVMAGAVLAAGVSLVARATPESGSSFFMPLFGDLKAELEAARNDGRKGIVLIYEMDGCPFCERLKRVALRSPDVRRYYHANFLVYRIDVRGATELTAFDGAVGTESSFAKGQGVRETPTIAFYDLGGSELTRLVGPPTDAAEFLLLGRYVVEGHYRSRAFPVFRQMQKQGAK